MVRDLFADDLDAGTIFLSIPDDVLGKCCSTRRSYDVLIQTRREMVMMIARNEMKRLCSDL
jgi:hypothetical protein